MSQTAVHHCHQTATRGVAHAFQMWPVTLVCLHMQLICMAKKRGTKVINVVRRDDVVQELKDLGYASLISGLHAFLHVMPCCLTSAKLGTCAQGSAS